MRELLQALTTKLPYPASDSTRALEKALKMVENAQIEAFEEAKGMSQVALHATFSLKIAERIALLLLENGLVNVVPLRKEKKPGVDGLA